MKKSIKKYSQQSLNIGYNSRLKFVSITGQYKIKI